MPNFKHVFLAILACLSSALIFGQEKTPQVLHLKVTSDIDPRSNRYVSLGLEKATEMNVDYIILELDTYGGALTDADEIRTAILNYERPVYAFINKDAASAGALISMTAFICQQDQVSAPQPSLRVKVKRRLININLI
jgi:membrane-bound serine protease (ClpP class)